MKIILSNDFFKNIIVKIFNILKIYYENIIYLLFDFKVNLFTTKHYLNNKFNSINIQNIKKYSSILQYIIFVPVFSFIYMYFVSKNILQKEKINNIDKINQLLGDIN